MLTLVCGMRSEAEVFQGHPELQVLYGEARNNLVSLVSKDSKGLISAGTAGGLVAGPKRGDLIIGAQVIALDGTLFNADAKWIAAIAAAEHADRTVGRIFSAPNMVTQTPVQRAAIASKYQAIADDEESWAVAQAAYLLKLPFVILRAVSDQSDQTLLPDDAYAINPDGSVDILKELPDVVRDPNEAALEFEGMLQALSRLRMTFNKLGTSFAFPY